MTKKHDSEKELKQKIEELEESRKRIAAELANYRKRVEAQKIDSIEFANANFMAEVTPVIDSFERALIDTPDDAFSKGMTQIKKQLEYILISKGLKQIEVKPGDKFDHNFHHAISSVPDDKIPLDYITNVSKSGWLFNSKVIKAAEVIVSRGQEEK